MNESLLDAIETLAKEGFYPAISRLADVPIPGSPTKATQSWWQVKIPTMKLKTIPQAFGNNPVSTLKECEKELRMMLADPQWHHKP